MKLEQFWKITSRNSRLCLCTITIEQRPYFFRNLMCNSVKVWREGVAHERIRLDTANQQSKRS